MSKKFAPRVSKKARKKISIKDQSKLDLFKFNDDKLLKGAQLAEVSLAKIEVKKQVRTKFNDSSLKELADNIKANGLIQPLVVHREKDKFVLLCGERRFRAMTLIKMKEAPCFILEGKTQEELMAIQFSENSSREELHYIDKADGVFNYQKATKASERKIQEALGISKSEVHRGLIIAKLPEVVKKSAKAFNIEKYVLLEYSAMEDKKIQAKAKKLITSGEITKRLHIRRFLKENMPEPVKKVRAIKKQTTKPTKAERDLDEMKKILKKIQENPNKIDKKTQKKMDKFFQE